MASTRDQILARSALYELLSVAFLYPEPGTRTFLVAGARELCPLVTAQGREGAAATLGKLIRRLRAVSDAALTQYYLTVFGHIVSSDCPPYETEYGQAHIFQKSQALTDLGAFYAAFGVVAGPDTKERPDHISTELEFMHLLTLKEACALDLGHGEDKLLVCRDAQESFLTTHLGPWARTFAERVRQKAGKGNVYGLLATLLGAHILAEIEALRLQSVPSLPYEPTEEPQDSEGCDAGPALVAGQVEGGVR